MISIPRLVRSSLMAASMGAAAIGQCDPYWAPGSGLPGVDGKVHAVLEWDPDGNGPLPGGLLVGGEFAMAGAIATSNVAFVDRGTGTWTALGTGIDGPVRALAALPTGDVVAAGSFATAGGVAAANLARWDGGQWRPLGNGLGAAGIANIASLLVRSSGELVAAGSVGIHRWNGLAWSALTASAGSALAELPNGTLVAAVGQTVQSWNGSGWQVLGTGSGQVRALAVLTNGDLVVGGSFGSFAGVGSRAVARWNGSSWSAMGPGFGPTPHATVTALSALAGGGLIAGGTFENVGNVDARSVARWNGNSWAALGDGVSASAGIASLVTLTSGELVVGGDLLEAGNTSVLGLASWNGSDWSHAVPFAMPAPVLAVAQLPNGEVVVGGGGSASGHIARWDGSHWQPLGGGTDGNVRAIAVLPGGDVLVGGNFTTAGGVPANGVARWDGTAWSALGAGLGVVLALEVLPNGDLVAGGSFAGGVARWDGSSWTVLGGGFTSPSYVYDLLLRDNGDLIAGGAFFAPGIDGLARWDGSSWSSLGAIANGSTAGVITAMVELPNGNLVVGGNFSAIGGQPLDNVARWDGNSWFGLGSGTQETVAAMTAVPGGDLLVASYSPGPDRLQRWNGTAWTPIGGIDRTPFVLASLTNGDVLAGGPGTTTGPAPGAFLARRTTPCPAAASPSGVTCTGSNGPNELRAQSLPWAGTTFRANASGLPQNGLAAIVTGTATQTVPLTTLLPEGLPGCALLVTTDAVGFAVPTNGSLAYQLPVPPSPALAGTVLQQQVVALELDATNVVVALTASNRLTLVVGSF